MERDDTAAAGTAGRAEAALAALREEVAARAAGLSVGEGAGGDLVDLGRLRRRREALEALRSLLKQVQDTAAEISRLGGAAEAAHRAELAAVRAQFEAAEPAGAGAGTAAVVAARARPPPPAAGLAPAPTPVPVTISAGVELRAMVLSPRLRGRKEVEDAVSPGELYFIPAWRQFATKVGGRLFHSNVGQLYWGAPKPGQTPARVRACGKPACRTAGRGAGGCAFYHDPEAFPGSSDVRNFLAEGWLYSPAAAPTARGSRHFGSLAELAEDLAEISKEDAALYVAQTAHNLICALILDRLVLLGAP